MGCDIHMYVEKKEKDKWIALSGLHPMRKFYLMLAESAFTETERLEEMHKMKGYPMESYVGWLYDDRNYDLFALLADVRNSIDIKPIKYPEGLPDDISDLVRYEYESWGWDAHSANYYTLNELLEYDWDQGILNEANEKVPFKEISLNFMKAIETLKTLSDNPNDIRIVFWFDN